jgi:hypothetical protein
MILMLLSLAAAAFGQNFSGTYTTKHDQNSYSLKLTQDRDGKVSGTLSEGGTELQIQAKAESGKLSGTAVLKGAPIKFFIAAKRESGKLILEVTEAGADGQPDPRTTEKITFDAPDGPAGQSDKPAPGKPEEKPAPARTNPLSKGPVKKDDNGSKTAGTDRREAAEKVFRHPVGLTVRYPNAWTLKQADGGLFVLIPPSAGQDELYILGGTETPGVTRADDPRTAQAADAAIAQLGSALQRKGPGEAVKVGDKPGIIFTYEGGPNGRARVYAVIHKEHAVAITAIGNKEKVDARDTALRKIFAGFVLSEGERDPAIVGAWRNVGTRSIDARDSVGRQQASSVGESHRTVILRADGTCTSRDVSRTIAIGAGVSIDTGDQVTEKSGKWYAGGGKLILAWDKSAEEYDYRVTGAPGARQISLKLDEKRESLWAEAR